MNRTVPVTEDELHAFVDGELPPDREQEVRAWLASHPQDAARVAAWREQSELIRSRYAGVIDEPLPQRHALSRLRWSGGRPWRWAAVAAMGAFLVGGITGWSGRDLWDGPPSTKAVTADAIEAHKLYVVEVRHPVEVPAEAAHLVPWLSKRVGHALHAPDLAALELKLVGGRLLPSPDGAAAFFMYEAASGERFTLYCARVSEPASAMRYSTAGTVAAFHWSEGDIAYVVSGPSERSRLQSIAEAAYEQIETRAGAKNPNS